MLSEHTHLTSAHKLKCVIAHTSKYLIVFKFTYDKTKWL